MLPADRRDEQAAQARYNALFARDDATLQERLPKLTEQGVLQTAGIHFEGVPVAVVWYRVERERLIVDTLMAISKGRTTPEAFQTIWAGVEQIGRARGCSCVEGITGREALAKVYLDNGFEARGVLMRKEISCID